MGQVTQRTWSAGRPDIAACRPAECQNHVNSVMVEYEAVNNSREVEESLLLTRFVGGGRGSARPSDAYDFFFEGPGYDS